MLNNLEAGTRLLGGFAFVLVQQMLSVDEIATLATVSDGNGKVLADA